MVKTSKELLNFIGADKHLLFYHYIQLHCTIWLAILINVHVYGIMIIQVTVQTYKEQSYNSLNGF